MHGRFKNILDEIKEFGKKSESEVDKLSTEETEKIVNPLNQPTVTYKQNVRMLIKEIQQIQSDLRSVQNLLQSRSGSDRVKTAKLTRQIDDIFQILDGQLFRADKLLP